MRLAYIYFCYKNDQELLKLSLDNLDWLRQKDDIDVYLIDDASNPMTEIPTGVTYEKSTFDRKMNLKGRECIMGMLNAYELILAKKDYDWLIKLDADVIINSWDWLRPADPTKHFQAGTMHQQFVAHEGELGVCHGCVHGFSRKGIEEMRKMVNAHEDEVLFAETEHYPEDRFTSRLLSMNGLDTNWFIKNTTNNPVFNTQDHGVYFDFVEAKTFPRSFKCVPLKMLTQYSAITFKQMTTAQHDSDYGRDHALRRMRSYVSHKLNRIQKCQQEFNPQMLVQFRTATECRDRISVNDLLEHSFVISIDKTQREAMEAVFAKDGLTPVPKTFEGFQAKKICAWRNQDGQRGHIDVNHVMFPVINCEYSHAAVIKIAQHLDWPYVCIFEDDAWPIKNICRRLQSFIEKVPTDIKFLILGWNSSEHIPDSYYCGKYQKFKHSFGSHAYIVFKSGYQAYFDAMRTENAVADVIFSRLPDIYQTTTNLFVQYNVSKSTVSNNIGYHRKRETDFYLQNYHNPKDLTTNG